MAVLLVFTALLATTMAGDLLYPGVVGSVYPAAVGVGAVETAALPVAPVVGSGLGIGVSGASLIGKGFRFPGPVIGSGIGFGIAGAPVIGKGFGIAGATVIGKGVGFAAPVYRRSLAIAADPVISKGVIAVAGPVYGKGVGVAPVVGAGGVVEADGVIVDPLYAPIARKAVVPGFIGGILRGDIGAVAPGEVVGVADGFSAIGIGKARVFGKGSW